MRITARNGWAGSRSRHLAEGREPSRVRVTSSVALLVCAVCFLTVCVLVFMCVLLFLCLIGLVVASLCSYVFLRVGATAKAGLSLSLSFLHIKACPPSEAHKQSSVNRHSGKLRKMTNHRLLTRMLVVLPASSPYVVVSLHVLNVVSAFSYAVCCVCLVLCMCVCCMRPPINVSIYI